MKQIYLVCMFDSLTGESHEVVAAFSTYDKAEDFYFKKTNSKTKHPDHNYLIETIAVDVE